MIHQVDCEGETHRVMVGHEDVVLLDHDLESELALVALDGYPCECLIVGLRIRWLLLPDNQVWEWESDLLRNVRLGDSEHFWERAWAIASAERAADPRHQWGVLALRGGRGRG